MMSRLTSWDYLVIGLALKAATRSYEKTVDGCSEETKNEYPAAYQNLVEMLSEFARVSEIVEKEGKTLND